jgi:hypothetical protein
MSGRRTGITMSLPPIRITAAAMLVALAGCNISDRPHVAYIQAIHAVPDAPTLSVAADEIPVTLSLGYQTSTGSLVESIDGATATRRLRIQPVLPDGQAGETLLTADVPMAENVVTTAVITGSYDEPEIVTAQAPRRTRPINALYFQFVHAAPAVAAIDVYVTAPGEDLTATAPFARLEPRGRTESVEVPFEDRRIRFTAAGTLDVVFDSGTLRFDDDTASDADGAEWLFAAIASPGVGASPMELLASNGAQATLTRDAAAPASLRVFHASPDAPAFDVVVGDAFDAPLGSNIAYRQRSPLAALQPGSVNLNFPLAGSSDEFVLEEQLEVDAGEDYSLFVLDELADIRALVSSAPRRSIRSEARIRVVNAAPDSEFFSAYLSSGSGASQDAEDRIFRDIRFETASNYVSANPGDYQLTLTERFYASGQDPSSVPETVTIGPIPLSLSGGDVVTLLILPPPAAGQAEELSVFDELEL